MNNIFKKSLNRGWISLKRKISKTSYIIVFLVILSLLAYNRKNKSEDLNPARADLIGAKDQILNLAIGLEPDTLDSSRNSDNHSKDILINIMEPLTRLEEDEDLNTIISPAGAKSWELSADGRIWIFKIRDGIWSDGQEISAEDYAYGIKRSIDPKTASPYAYLLYEIENAKEVNTGQMPVEELGVRVIDEKTLEISLESAIPYFLDLTHQSPMLPQREDLVKKHGEKYGTDPDTLVYNGPFVLASWNHDSQIVLEKNRNYWDKDRVSLEKINIDIIKDENTMMKSFIQGEIDQVSTYKVEWKDKFAENENIKNYQIDQADTRFLFFNIEDPLFKNANIRKAFLMAIDRDHMASVLAGEFSRPASGLVSSSVKLAGHEFRDLVDSPIEKIQEEELDPRALLSQGLEELDIDKDLSKMTVKLTLGSTDKNTRKLADYLKENYKQKLGLELKINQLEGPVFESLIDDGDFQMAALEWKAEYNDPMSFFNLFRADAKILNNGWHDLEYDENINLANEEIYQSDRLKYLARCEEILLYDQVIIVPLTHSIKHSFIYEHVEELGISPFSSAGYKYTYIK